MPPTPFLEPTPKRIRALAWAFTWRYQAGYALAFYVFYLFFGIEALSESSPTFPLLLLMLYEANSLPQAIVKMLYYKPIQDFKVVLVTRDGIVNPSSFDWSPYFHPYFALIPFLHRFTDSIADDFITPDRSIITLYFVFIFCFLILFILLPPGEIRLIGFWTKIALLPPLLGFAFSYYAFKRVLQRTDTVGQVRLIPFTEEKDYAPLQNYSSEERARPLVVQIAWSFLWRHLALLVGIFTPLLVLSVIVLFASHTLPSIASVKDSFNQIPVWLLLKAIEICSLLFILHLVSQINFGRFVLRYQYKSHFITKKEVTLWQWFRLHMPFLFGYAALDFIVRECKQIINFSIKSEFFERFWSTSVDMIVLYLLFTVLIRYGCLGTRYVIEHNTTRGR